MQQQTLISSSKIIVYGGDRHYDLPFTTQIAKSASLLFTLVIGKWPHTQTNATGYTQRCCSWKQNPVYERSLVANLPALKDCYLAISIKCFQPSFLGFLFGAADVETNPLNPSKSHQATAACLTPWTDFKAFSTTPTQAAQVIPVQRLKYHWVFVNCRLSPRWLTARPWKLMVGRQAFPIGIR